MATAFRECITGVWEQSPQWGPGAPHSPLSRGHGDDTPEAKNIHFFDDLRRAKFNLLSRISR